MSATNPNEATGLHPTARVAEKRRDIRFAAKDAGLRQDVHNLGELVGALLTEQGGDRLFNAVERGRVAAIARREGDEQGSQDLDRLVSSLSPSQARRFIRAFSTYFQVVNSAEQVHRIRRRRDYLKDSDKHQPGGPEDTVFKLRAEGYTLKAVLDLLETIQIEPVFTAHPTEPTRRTILRKHQAIVRRLIESQDSSMTPRDRAACFESIRDNVTAIWQTEEHPGSERTSGDELEHVLFYLTDVIYKAIPAFYEALQFALTEAYGELDENLQLPVLIRFASWIGGDIHGRPETTARTIRQTLQRQRTLILDLYFGECRGLADKLSQSRKRVGIAPEILERIDEYSGHFPQAAGSIPQRHADMPYRIFLRLIMARLKATYDDDAFPYESPEELLADLNLIATSLIEHRGRHAGLFPLRRFIRRVETFGFHFLTLDIRQSALVNRRVVGHCLDEEGWMNQSGEYRARRIHEALENNESPCGGLDNETRRDLAVFQAIAYCRRKFGERAIGPYVVSMAHDVDDVLSVILLARWGDLCHGRDQVPLDIAPYFETVDDLAGCTETMSRLLQDSLYREHLRQRGDRQTVMLSYTDSTRDGGLAPARWALQRAQASLARVLGEAGVDFTLFHGRGGSISRGGGKTHGVVMGAPAGSVRGHLRATEQGELVNAKYGLRGIAMRTLEQAVGSVALATAIPRRLDTNQLNGWIEVMHVTSAASRERYQALVYARPEFYDYFRAATPVDVIDRMRQDEFTEAAEQTGVAQLRGVAWDFAWAQSRHVLPGWYGLGSGLTKAVNTIGLEGVREMAREWPFFRNLLLDLETILSKADLGIAARYSALAGELHDEFFPSMKTEFDLTVEKLLEITGQQVLLEKRPNLRRSIRLRNPYVDPMSLLQVDFLQRWREGGRQDDELFAALLASVNGIARGLQDSG